MSKEFNTKSILDAVVEYVGEGETLEDIQDTAFNLDPWIIGTYKAAEALKDFDEQDQLYEKTYLNGVFGAIQYVKDYGELELGEVTTNLSNPEELASAVAFINGEQVISELSEKFNVDLDDELTEQQAKQLSSVETMQTLLDMLTNK